MTLETALNNVLSATLILIATALAVAIRQGAVWIERYAREKIGHERYGLLKGMATTIVRSLEQSGVWRQLDAQGKKEQALLFLQQYAGQLGLNIDVAVLDHMIEEAVQIMNAEVGKIELDLVGAPEPQVNVHPGAGLVQ